MHLLQWPRRAGRTSYLAQLTKDNPDAVMLVESAKIAEQIRRDYGLSVRQVISFQQLREAWRGHTGRVVHIDNAELLLQQLIGPNTLGTVSFTDVSSVDA